MDLYSLKSKQKNSPIRDAANLSGYSTGYLSSLCRTGKVIGTYAHNEWSVDIASLERFMQGQAERKEARARALAHARANEYRTHSQNQSIAPSSPRHDPRSGIISGRQVDTPEAAPQKISIEKEIGLVRSSFRDHARALSLALLAVTSGAVIARASMLSQPATNAAAFVAEISSGFNETFGDIPSHIAAKIDGAKNTASEISMRVASSPIAGSEPIQLAMEGLSSVRAPSFSWEGQTLPNFKREHAPAIASSRSLSRDAYALITHPMSIIDALAQAYIALGTTVIDTAHAVIHADVSLAYVPATAAPGAARVAMSFIGGTGDALARATTLAAARARAALAFASRGLNGAGYDGAVNARRALAFLSVPDFPAMLEDAYLGALGKSALALHSLGDVGRTPKMAAALAAAQPALNIGERAALSTYEAIHNFFGSASGALATLFGSSPAVVQPVIAPRPIVALATSTPASRGSTLTQNPQGRTSGIATYPTYVTNVNGITQADLNQSLTALRTGILATVAGMISPVSSQVATNVSSIQYVNMIQKLDSLIVTNGDFQGGKLTNGTLVSAANGTFTNLTGGATTLATTTITGPTTITGDTTIAGNFTTSGSLSSGTSASAPYFTATSSTATSTFAGHLAIGTTTPAASSLFEVGTSTPLLYVDSNTGNVGIGTSSPSYTLAVEGSSTLGNQAIAGYFTATSTTATSTFSTGGLTVGGSQFVIQQTSGRIGIGTTTPDALLSLLQPANGTPFISAYRITDSAPSGDFINYKMKSGTTLFRVDNSGNLLAGGVITSGSQTITSTSQPQFRVQYDPSNEITFSTGSTGTTTLGVNGSSGGSLAFTPQSNSVNTFNFTDALAANSVLSIDTLNRRVGISQTSPTYKLDVTGNGHFTSFVDAANFVATSSSATSTFAGGLAVGTSQFVVQGATGNVGIGTASPASKLDVAGFINTSGTIGGYKIDGNLILQASSTNFSTLAGQGAGAALLSDGMYNTAVGYHALNAATSSDYNTAIGYQALMSNTTGFENTAIGWNALSSNTTGYRNNANGLSALAANTTGIYNTAYGTGALGSNTEGNFNVANGGNVLYNNTTGNNNTVSGVSAFFNNTTGYSNVAMGFYAGYNASVALQTISSSTFIGYGANSSVDGIGNSMALGNGAQVTKSNQVVIGNNSVVETLLNGNVGIGSTTPGYKLAVAGSGYFDGGTVIASVLTATSSISAPSLTLTGVSVNSLLSTNATGVITATSTPTFGNFNATSTVATSTISTGGLAVGTNQFVVQQATGNVGIGTTSPAGILDILGSTVIQGVNIRAGGASGQYPFRVTHGGPSATNGSYFAIDNNGNVGIGTTGPLQPLQVGALTGVSDGQIVLAKSNSGPNRAFKLGLDSNYNFSLGDYGANGANSYTPYITVGYTGSAIQGNVGIGTTSPGTKLEVSQDGTVNNRYIRLTDTAASGSQWDLVNRAATIAGSFGIYDNTNAAYRMVINSSGNVGIGTTSPFAKLSISDTSNGTNQLEIAGNSSTVLTHLGNFSGGTYFFSNYYYNGGHHSDDATATSTGIEFDSTQIALQYAPPSVTPTRVSALAISTTGTTAGNVGIGTTNPLANLQVVGATSYAGLNVQEILTDTTTFAKGVGGQLAFEGRYQTAAGYANFASVGGFKENVTDGDYAGYLGFYTRPSGQLPTEKMRITSTGNVGIGTTSPLHKLDVRNGDIYSATDYPGTGVTPTNRNIWMSAINANNVETAQTGISSVFERSSDTVYNSGLAFYTSISNSPTEKMRIDKNGNVGIGTTTPLSTLAVGGTGGASIGADYNIAAPTNGLIVEGSTYIGASSAVGGGGQKFQVTNSGDTVSMINSTTNGTGRAVQRFNVPDGSGNLRYGGIYFVPGSTGAANSLAMYADDVGGSAATSLTLLGSGNVGIGTVSPVKVLDVAAGTLSSGADVYTIIRSSNDPGIGASANDAKVGIRFVGWNGDVSSNGQKQAGIYAISENADYFKRAGLGLFTADTDTAMSEKVRITGSGNVGIGTAGPVSELDVSDGTRHSWINPRAVTSGTGLAAGLDVATNGNYVLNLAGDMAGGGTSGGVNVSYYSSGNGLWNAALAIRNTTGSSNGNLLLMQDGGNVGIGTASPGYPFTTVIPFAATDTTRRDLAMFGSNDAHPWGLWLSQIGNATEHNRVFALQTTQATVGSDGLLALQPDGGNVGIGTTSPAGILDILGSTVIQGVNIRAGGASGQYPFRVTHGGPSATNGSYFAIDNNGNVGIGTTNPLVKLDVSGGAGGLPATSGSTPTALLSMENTSSVSSLYFGTDNNSPYGSWLQAANSNALGTYEPLNLNPRGGNVGIGTTNPTYKLDVAGNGHFTGLVDAPNFVATSTTATSTFAGGFSVGLCVTGDTRLRRRRRRPDGSYCYDECRIDEIQAGDEIASLDESTGRVVYSRVKQLMAMGEHEVFELVTKSGRRIRTTANHPYLARFKQEIV